MAKVGTSSMIFILFLCLLPGVFLGVLETGNKSTHAVLTINTLLWEESEGSFRDSALPDSLFFFFLSCWISCSGLDWFSVTEMHSVQPCSRLFFCQGIDHCSNIQRYKSAAGQTAGE